MKFPKRIAQHVSESVSFKIFSRYIPDHWIIREVTERDYGVDCYIELVTNDDELTGDLVSVQLKSRESINWTKENTYSLTGIEVSTSNYWYHFAVPVFIFLVDLSKEEVFFLPVKQHIKRNFIDYAKQKKFTYKMQKNLKLDKAEGLAAFIYSFQYERLRERFENHLLTFVTNLQRYKDFIQENTGRDFFMGVEAYRILALRSFYNNARFLCSYLSIDWGIDSLKDYERLCKERYGDDYDLYEQQIDEIVTKLESKLLPIVEKLKDIVTDMEKSYWIITDIKMFNFMINIDEEGNISWY